MVSSSPHERSAFAVLASAIIAPAVIVCLLFTCVAGLAVVGALGYVYVINPDMLAPQPALSGLGHIVFASDRTGIYQIYLMESNGTDVVQLTGDSARNIQPDLSPDGRQVVYVSEGPLGKDLFLLTLGPRSPSPLTQDHQGYGDPAWSPDGSQIAFTMAGDQGDVQIAVMNADGSGLISITQGQIDSHPTWSPDGEQLAFARMTSDGYDVFVIDLRTTHLDRLTYDIGDDYDPAWSPDGTRIAFISERWGWPVLFLMGPDGSGVVQLASTGSVEQSSPNWSPDGKYIIFAQSTPGYTAHDLYVADPLYPYQQMILTLDPSIDAFPDWGP